MGTGRAGQTALTLSGAMEDWAAPSRPSPGPELLSFTGLLLVSGIYDLEPLVFTSQNDLLHMTL